MLVDSSRIKPDPDEEAFEKHMAQVQVELDLDPDDEIFGHPFEMEPRSSAAGREQALKASNQEFCAWIKTIQRYSTFTDMADRFLEVVPKADFREIFKALGPMASHSSMLEYAKAAEATDFDGDKALGSSIAMVMSRCMSSSDEYRLYYEQIKKAGMGKHKDQMLLASFLRWLQHEGELLDPGYAAIDQQDLEALFQSYSAKFNMQKSTKGRLKTIITEYFSRKRAQGSVPG